MVKKEKDVIQKFNDGDELTSAEKDFDKTGTKKKGNKK